MESTSSNPLVKYFRQPAIYIELPSKGRWYPKGSLNLPLNGEIPVSPMTTKDEITLKTPDALLNGQGIIDVIQSCCPNIVDAWQMPSVDVDAVLIAIRIASYGPKLEFTSKCAHCKESNTHEIDLSTKLSSITCPSFDDVIPYRDLKIKLQPQSYFNASRASKIKFEEEQLLKVLSMSVDTPPDIKSKLLTERLDKIVSLSLMTLATGTAYIELPNGDRVTDPDYLQEFYASADSALVKTLNDTIAQYAINAKLTTLRLQCNDCSKEYQTELTFDYSRFFVKRS